MNYYNENDPKAAAWLRELIKQGLIPPGEVDERSIVDVKPDELSRFIQCHFFAGIGGWSLALRLAGWPTDKPVYTGSCPCQPFSEAGEKKGFEDERHLWPEFFRLIKARNPSTVLGEQVASALGRQWLAGVFADLEGMGYHRAGADLCAAGVKSPHMRQRLYWVGVANGRGRQQGQPTAKAAGYGSSIESDGSFSGMADIESQRCDRESAATESAGGNFTEASGDAIGVADVRGQGPQERKERKGINERQAIERSGPFSGLGDSALPQGPRFRQQRKQLHGSSAWSNFDIIQCRDGKARRVESGTFPLAHGIPGRVGLLRGYGNAIVPQVAAEFIKAFVETEH